MKKSENNLDVQVAVSASDIKHNAKMMREVKDTMEKGFNKISNQLDEQRKEFHKQEKLLNRLALQIKIIWGVGCVVLLACAKKIAIALGIISL